MVFLPVAYTFTIFSNSFSCVLLLFIINVFIFVCTKIRIIKRDNVITITRVMVDQRLSVKRRRWIRTETTSTAHGGSLHSTSKDSLWAPTSYHQELWLASSLVSKSILKCVVTEKVEQLCGLRWLNRNVYNNRLNCRSLRLCVRRADGSEQAMKQQNHYIRTIANFTACWPPFRSLTD